MRNASRPFAAWGIALTRRKRKAPKIKWSLFASFTAMTVLIMILLWVLHLLLLSFVYDWTTRSRMQSLVYEIAYEAQGESFEERAELLAESAGTAMHVYRVEGDTYLSVAQAEERDGISHLLDSADARALLQKAKESDGVFQERLQIALEKNHFPAARQNERLLTVFVTSNQAGEQYLIVLDTAVMPLRSLIYLMQNQLSVISLILLVVSACISFLLARHIASPIERISQKAKQMAKGELSIDFSERSYHEIEELSEILNQTAEELSTIDRLQKELIANISHDLRTPLTMIVGYAEMMRDVEGENTPENVQVIIDEATRLSGLVNDLLEISRIQGGVGEREDELFDLSDLAKETVERYRRLKENSGFTFSFERSEGNMTVSADRAKITQVLCNLINNAINYSEDDRRIHVCLTAKEGRVRLAVIDHGVGIAPENLEHVWQRYYREDKNHRRSIAGSGLGLSIVQKILDLHRARYGVTSTLGEGSTFWFELAVENEKLLVEQV